MDFSPPSSAPPAATNNNMTSSTEESPPPSKKRKSQKGGLTKDNLCKRCVLGPSYKKGHHVSCPKSAYHAEARYRPFPIKKPRLTETKQAYKELKSALNQDVALLAKVEQYEKMVKEAQEKLAEAEKEKEAQAQTIEEARKKVVKAEMKEPDDWYKMLFKLKQYGELHGNILFERGCHEQNKDDAEYQALCAWVRSQRNKRDRITWQRKMALDQIGFEWDPFEATWKKQYMELQAFCQEHGHTHVLPSGDEQFPKLAAWVVQQRKQYKLYRNEEKSQMTAERIKLLEDLGFEWTRAQKEDKWLLEFGSLVLYKNTHGDFLVPEDYPLHPSLPMWVALQRTHYQLCKEGKPSMMTLARIKKLDEIGFPWSKEGQN